MGARAAVRHADAAGVDDEAAVGEADVRHVGVAADHRADCLGDLREDLRPAVGVGVDQDDLLVVAGCGVTEEDVAEATDGERAGRGQGG